MAWDQEVPQQLWIGHRAQANQILSDDPNLMNRDVAESAHFPGGHIEGWPDAFKNMMAQFYRAVMQGRCRHSRCLRRSMTARTSCISLMR